MKPMPPWSSTILGLARPDDNVKIAINGVEVEFIEGRPVSASVSYEGVVKLIQARMAEFGLDVVPDDITFILRDDPGGDAEFGGASVAIRKG